MLPRVGGSALLWAIIAVTFGRVPSRRCMRITFRPNLFGSSFGRKLGVLYDDYVKVAFVSACAINKREDDIVLHTQEVTGSSPVAPTIESITYRTSHRERGWVWLRVWHRSSFSSATAAVRASAFPGWLMWNPVPSPSPRQPLSWPPCGRDCSA